MPRTREVFLLVIVCVFSLLGMSSQLLLTPSLVAKYEKVPDFLNVERVIVVHRHGDRAQISKGLGVNFPRNADVEAVWHHCLPSDRSCRAMVLSGSIPSWPAIANSEFVDFKANLYRGWDKINYPYAQLTELGFQQMRAVGNELRERYCPSLVPSDMFSAKSGLHLRSTSMCRTGQSLLALLSGLFKIDPEASDDNIPSGALAELPSIHIRTYEEETLFPNHGAAAMAKHRNLLDVPGLAAQKFDYYGELEQTVRETLGLSKVSWEMVLEVLHCHMVHGIDYIKGLPDGTLQKARAVAGWHWGLLYKDPILNRLAIGRFIYDLLADLRCALGDDCPGVVAASRVRPYSAHEEQLARHKKLLIYSGHDSTLVPLLCSLGLYDDEWPPYASHLALEIARSKEDSSAWFVRAVYNNENMCMFGGVAPVWCPLEDFWCRMEKIALSVSELEELAQKVEQEESPERDVGGADAVMTAKEVEEEIAATITGKN